MNTCKECKHAEMCKWVDELEGRGCDFFDGEQGPCTDAVSRKNAVRCVLSSMFLAEASEKIEKLPSVNPQPCKDAISRDAVIKAVDAHTNEDGTLDDDISVILENLPTVTQKPKYWIDKDNKLYKMPDDIPQKSGKWIALVTRPMTNEEREYYSEQLDYCDGDAVIYDCPLPEEGQEVLITTCTGWVLIDTFFNDYDGCGFEGYDIEDVKAWMPLPKPYEPQESEE